MSGCPPLPLQEAYKACAYLASRMKKGHGVSHRDISGLIDRGAYISEATTWSDRWWWMAGDGGLHMAWRRSSLPRGGGGEERLSVTGELTSTSVTTETIRGAHPHCPFDENNHQLGPGMRAWEGQFCE